MKAIATDRGAMRADQLLVERGLAASRSQAARLIAAGLRWREAQADAASAWRTVAKNRDELPLDAELELVDAAEARYVSRGGLKLEGALGIAGLEVGGLRCLDIGQSSGGFTDCLLQHGADHVVGVDVGHGQLHQRLRDDERVTVIEKVNARHLRAQDLIPVDPDALDLEQDADGAGEVEAADAVVEAMEPVETPNFALIVGDLSFISLTLVLWPYLTALGSFFVYTVSGMRSFGQFVGSSKTIF